MHLLLSGLGSYGDVLPMAGLGAALRGRGWEVDLVANPYFQHVADAAGINLVPLGSADEYRALMAHADLWHPRRGLALVLREGLVRYLEPLWRTMSERYRPGETVIAAHGLDLASRVLQEKRGAPLATVHFAPFALKTLHATPRYMNAPTLSRGPRWWRAVQFRLGSRWVIDPIVAPALNGLRNAEGLPPVRDVFDGWNNSPQLVIGAWPEWFAPPQPDWPSHTALVGFPLWDPHAGDPLPAELAEFLSAGEPPLAFAPGSANIQAKPFFAAAIDACQLLRRRGLLLTKYPEQLPALLPPGIMRVGFVSFAQLLPRVAALVHHGGVGTCGQGLACGARQIVAPMAYDQLDNGTRLERLGVGVVIPTPRFTATRVARELETLLDSAETAANCRELAARCDGAATRDAAADLIEGLLPGKLRRTTHGAEA